MKTIIIGKGQVGDALYQILRPFYPVHVFDPKFPSQSAAANSKKDYKFMHICFPFSSDFIGEVKKYQKKYKPRFTIIHSTVPVGTSRKCDAIHSPVRGMHPDLVRGIKTFVKFIGGQEASLAADYFRNASIKVYLFDKSETTEAMKLFDTEYYRTCIEFTQRVKRYCDKHNLNFHEVYNLANQTYNEGYTKLGYPEFIRPVLQPIMTPIGGHCVIPNSGFIDE